MTRREITDSSWISAIEYFPTGQNREGILHVHLSSGKELVYGPVPCWIFGLFVAAKSKGRFFNFHVRSLPYWRQAEDGSFFRMAG